MAGSDTGSAAWVLAGGWVLVLLDAVVSLSWRPPGEPVVAMPVVPSARSQRGHERVPPWPTTTLIRAT